MTCDVRTISFGKCPSSINLHRFLIVNCIFAIFNREKTLVGAFFGHCAASRMFVDSSDSVCSPPRPAPPRPSAAATPTPPSPPPRPTWGRRPGRTGTGRPRCSIPGSRTATGLRWSMKMTAAYSERGRLKMQLF